MTKLPLRKRLAQFGARLRDDKSAVALIEFAYTLPVMVAVFGGGTELANIALTHSRLSQIATMTADNAARVSVRIDETDIKELFEGSRQAGSSIGVTTHGRLIISSIEDRPETTGDTNDQKIVWQRCKGIKSVTSEYGAEGANLADPIATGTRSIQAMPNNPIIAVELNYTYQPIFSMFSFGVSTIRYKSAFTVRDRSNNAMQNGTNMAANQKATCNYYTAT